MMDQRATNKANIVNPTNAQIEEVFNDRHILTRRTHVARDVKQQKSAQLGVAPIPAHLVFDGFDRDLEAAVVYE